MPLPAPFTVLHGSWSDLGELRADAQGEYSDAPVTPMWLAFAGS